MWPHYLFFCCPFLVHQSFLICPWRVLNSLQTLFNFFLFPLLGNLKLFVPECLLLLISFTLLLNSRACPVNSMLAYFLLLSVLFLTVWSFIAENPISSTNSHLQTFFYPIFQICKVVICFSSFSETKMLCSKTSLVCSKIIV